MTECSLDGLLHLSALAVVLVAGYIGIDRIGREEARKFRATLLDVCRQVKNELLKLDLLTGNEASIPTALDIIETHTLCYIAGIRVVHIVDGDTKKDLTRIRRLRCFCGNHKRVPILNYFRNRLDRKVLFAVGASVTVDFFVLVASSVWNFAIPEFFLQLSYMVCTLAIITVFVTAIFAYALMRLKATAEHLLDRVAATARTVFALKESEAMRAFVAARGAAVRAEPEDDD